MLVRASFPDQEPEGAAEQGMITPPPPQPQRFSPQRQKGRIRKPVFFHSFLAICPASRHFWRTSRSLTTVTLATVSVLFSHDWAKDYSANPTCWVLRVWEWGEGLLGTASHQGPPGNKAPPQARPRWDSGRGTAISAPAPFPCWLFPQQPQGVFLALRMGILRQAGALAAAPGAVSSLRSRSIRPAGVRPLPPDPGGFTQSPTTFSSHTPRSGLETGTPGSPSSFKPSEQPEGWGSGEDLGPNT